MTATITDSEAWGAYRDWRKRKGIRSSPVQLDAFLAGARWFAEVAQEELADSAGKVVAREKPSAAVLAKDIGFLNVAEVLAGRLQQRAKEAGL